MLHTILSGEMRYQRQRRARHMLHACTQWVGKQPLVGGDTPRRSTPCSSQLQVLSKHISALHVSHMKGRTSVATLLKYTDEQFSQRCLPQ